MPTPPNFSVGQYNTAAYMNAIALWRINEFTLSGGTTNLTSIFSADYTNYLLVVSGASSTNAVVDSFQMLNGTTPATTANYNYTRFTTASAGSGATAQTSGQIMTTGNTPQAFTINIFNPFAAAKTQVNSLGQYGANADLCYTEIINATHTLATSYNGISLIATGTTWTAGKVTVYGYRP